MIRSGFMAGSLFRSVWEEEAGATTTEYALVLALVVVVLIGTLNTLGTTLQGKIADIIQELGEAGA